MTVTSSYGVEIRKMNICFRKTLEYYRGAVAWLITAYESVWEELKQIPGTKQQFNQKSKSPPSKAWSFREGYRRGLTFVRWGGGLGCRLGRC